MSHGTSEVVVEALIEESRWGRLFWLHNRTDLWCGIAFCETPQGIGCRKMCPVVVGVVVVVSVSFVVVLMCLWIYCNWRSQHHLCVCVYTYILTQIYLHICIFTLTSLSTPSSLLTRNTHTMFLQPYGVLLWICGVDIYDVKGPCCAWHERQGWISDFPRIASKIGT